MNCLSGKVGLKCSANGPDSGVSWYLSDLPGIHLAGATQIADHEQGTGENMLRESIDFAERMTAIDFSQRLRSKNLMIRDVISTEIAGVHGDGYQPFYPGTYGVLILSNNPDDPFVIGRLNYLELKVQNAVAGKTIIVTADGQIIDSISVDLVAGINRIQLGYSFVADASISMDVSDVNLSDGKSAYTNRPCVEDCCGDCLSFRGTTNGATTGGDLKGFVVSASCAGSIDSIVCSFADALAPAIMYRAGAHVMESLIISHRPNPYVRNTKDEARELYIRWMGGVDGRTGFETVGEYPRLLDQVVASSIASLSGVNSKAFAQAGIKSVHTVTPLFRPRVDLARRSMQNKLNFR